jgi:hypothetical protein
MILQFIRLGTGASTKKIALITVAMSEFWQVNITVFIFNLQNYCTLALALVRRTSLQIHSDSHITYISVIYTFFFLGLLANFLRRVKFRIFAKRKKALLLPSPSLPVPHSQIRLEKNISQKDSVTWYSAVK